MVLGHEHPYSKEPGNPAETAANAILNSRGNAPRLYQNTLVFLAPDRARLQDLDDAIRRFLAWDSILAEREALNLEPHQVKQTETQHRAISYDEAAKRYVGLRGGNPVPLSVESPQGLLVKPDVAVAQLDKVDPPITPPPPVIKPPLPDPPTSAPQLTRFHGSVQLDATRVGRDASRIAEEVISHLAGLVCADVKVTLEIEAHLPDGVSDQLVRIITENCRVLKFGSQGFEND